MKFSIFTNLRPPFIDSINTALAPITFCAVISIKANGEEKLKKWLSERWKCCPLPPRREARRPFFRVREYNSDASMLEDTDSFYLMALQVNDLNCVLLMLAFKTIFSLLFRRDFSLIETQINCRLLFVWWQTNMHILYTYIVLKTVSRVLVPITLHK